MNKDTIVASVIGFGLGLIAAISLWVVPRIFPKNLPQTTTTQESTSANNSATSAKSEFQITSPKDGEIVKSGSVKLTGQAPGAQLVIVTSSSESVVTTPSADGNFEANVPLKEGVNQLVVAALTDNQETIRELSIYYFNQEL